MTVAMVKDEWVRAAMTDDSVVVELLVRLKQTQTQMDKSAVVALRWGVRQPRSRSLRCDAVSQRSKGDSANAMTRASPNTPLSWSGGASPSATADEETSRHQTSAVRSKGILQADSSLGRFEEEATLLDSYASIKSNLNKELLQDLIRRLLQKWGRKRS